MSMLVFLERVSRFWYFIDTPIHCLGALMLSYNTRTTTRIFLGNWKDDRCNRQVCNNASKIASEFVQVTNSGFFCCNYHIKAEENVEEGQLLECSSKPTSLQRLWSVDLVGNPSKIASDKRRDSLIKYIHMATFDFAMYLCLMYVSIFCSCSM